MLKNKKIAVLGAGHIGQALIGGMLKGKLATAKNITATRRDPARRAEIKDKFGVNVTDDNAKAAKGADVIVLAVKPQAATRLLDQISSVVTKEQLVISVMAGIKTHLISGKLGAGVPVVRAMPNTPALIDEGATGISGGEGVSAAQMKLARHIFEAVGIVEELPEYLQDAVTGVSGSGPVYVYMIIEAMTDGGVKMGIPRPVAARLAAKTVLGAAKLVLDSGKHPALLKDDVTTPGGTAIAAIHELESKGLRTVLMDAIATATRRSKELSGEA